eukprot:gene22927-27719_t
MPRRPRQHQAGQHDEHAQLQEKREMERALCFVCGKPPTPGSQTDSAVFDSIQHKLCANHRRGEWRMAAYEVEGRLIDRKRELLEGQHQHAPRQGPAATTSRELQREVVVVPSDVRPPASEAKPLAIDLLSCGMQRYREDVVRATEQKVLEEQLTGALNKQASELTELKFKLQDSQH